MGMGASGEITSREKTIKKTKTIASVSKLLNSLTDKRGRVGPSIKDLSRKALGSEAWRDFRSAPTPRERLHLCCFHKSSANCLQRKCFPSKKKTSRWCKISFHIWMLGEFIACFPPRTRAPTRQIIPLPEVGRKMLRKLFKYFSSPSCHLPPSHRHPTDVIPRGYLRFHLGNLAWNIIYAEKFPKMRKKARWGGAAGGKIN